MINLLLLLAIAVLLLAISVLALNVQVQRIKREIIEMSINKTETDGDD